MASLVSAFVRRRDNLRCSASMYSNFQHYLTSTDKEVSSKFHLRLHPSTNRTFVTVTKTAVADVVTIASDAPVSNDPVIAITTTTSSSAHNTNALSVNVTPSCTDHILQLARKREIAPTDLYLRVCVDAGGCSGFQYAFEISTRTEEPLEKDDVVFSGRDGASVVVDETSLDFIQGSTIDYVREMIRSGFVVKDNPFSESACGCGSSFAVKNFEANPAAD